MSVYYNEGDDFAASWLEELIKDGLIPLFKAQTMETSGHPFDCLSEVDVGVCLPYVE